MAQTHIMAVGSATVWPISQVPLRQRKATKGCHHLLSSVCFCPYLHFDQTFCQNPSLLPSPFLNSCFGSLQPAPVKAPSFSSPLRIEWVGRDLKDHLVPTPCHGQTHLPLDQADQKPHPTRPRTLPFQEHMPSRAAKIPFVLLLELSPFLSQF